MIHINENYQKLQASYLFANIAKRVREYQDEKNQQLVMLIDTGRRMMAREDALGHFDHVLNASLVVSYLALRQGDGVGLFAAGGDRFLAQPLQCLERCLVLRIHASHLVMEAAAGRDRAAGGFAVDDHPSLFAPRSPGPVLPEGAGRRPTGRILIPIGELFTASFTGKKGRVQTL